MKQTKTKPIVLEALRSGETASLLLALVECTQRTEYLDAWGVYIKGAGRNQTDFPNDVAAEIRDAFAREVICYADDGSRLTSNPILRARLFDTAFGAPIPPAQHELLLKEMGLAKHDSVAWHGKRPTHADDLNVLVIGAGLSGIAMAMQLKKLKIPFKVIERHHAVGGTWLVNDYPGCGVDIASHCYSYSRDVQYPWEHYFAPQPEILSYLKDCADKEGLLSNVQFQTTVRSAVFDERRALWSVVVERADGTQESLEAKVVISAVGQLSTPYVPDLAGIQSFKGGIIHSAQWNHDIDLEGRRVVLVGGGASAIQIGPSIASKVSHLTILQRNPHWMMGAPNYHSPIPEGEKWLLQHCPAYARWIRARTVMAMTDAMRDAVMIDKDWFSSDGTTSAFNQQVRNQLVAYIRDQLGDRQDLADQVTPSYAPFVKRMLRDAGWYRTLLRENVTLATAGVARLSERGVVDQKGRLHEADVIIFATGFRAARMLGSADFTGRNGRTIRNTWGDEDPFAYLGMAVPSFPNFFVMYGPNTNIATGGSIFFTAECQASYIAQLLVEMAEGDLVTVEVKAEVCRNYNDLVQQKLSQMVWSQPGAKSWYQNSKGRVITNMPWSSFEYWQLTRRSNLLEYAIQASSPAHILSARRDNLATEER